MKFIEDPPEGEYLPALYKGEDMTGHEFGRYRVLGRSGTKRYSEKKIVAIWAAECLDCGNEYKASVQRIRDRKYGCHNCAHKTMSGNKHARWTGGEHVPGYFAAKFRAKLDRRTQTLEWALTTEYLDEQWITQGGHCAYTGWELQFGRTGLQAREQTASLDRIDSREGYVPGNVQFVHKDINLMKWNHSETRFVELCRAVAEYRKENPSV
ncbi:hypothetical protein [Nonomuraea typhae]|uniref:HNH endonuclease n=1 Tax=Nonomuraea typhae TaxID=2603600 RepID=A0ABW7YKR0_9ACTN